MTRSYKFIVAMSALNVACTAISVGQLPRVQAVGVEISDVVRTRHLEVLDANGRVRASITVHHANPVASDGGTSEESVVLRLVNTQGMPGVKLALSERDAGLALIARQGDYLQVSADGMKATKDFKQYAVWP